MVAYGAGKRKPRKSGARQTIFPFYIFRAPHILIRNDPQLGKGGRMSQEEWTLANQEAVRYFGLSCIQAMVILSAQSPAPPDSA